MKIEEFISKNRAFFDEEPATGHWERFQERRKDRKQGRRIVMWRWTAALAATVALLLTTLVVLHRPTEEPEMLCEDMPDMRACYMEQIHSEAARIKHDASHLDPQTQAVVMDEVRAIIHDAATEPEMLVPRELPEKARHEALAECYRRYLEGMRGLKITN